MELRRTRAESNIQVRKRSISMPSDRIHSELDDIEYKPIKDYINDKGIIGLRNSCFNYIKIKCNCVKDILIKLKEDFQKVLTLTDIGTDVRTCYIMYSINPYWYTIMLSAIVTPFIVFWASSYNFKFVVKLSRKADSDNSLKNKVLSGWITALSLPIIGVILTIITIIGIYKLQRVLIPNSSIYTMPLTVIGILHAIVLLVYDFNRLEKFIAKGDESWSTAVNMALSIYLDIVWLFLHILELFANEA